MDAFSNDAHARFNVRDFAITNLTGAWTLDSCVKQLHVCDVGLFISLLATQP